MNTNLDQMLAYLDTFEQDIPLDQLKRQLDDLVLDVDDIRDYVRFSPDRYQRNLLHTGPTYQALVLCWRNRQRSPIHDHRGSACGVRVLEGIGTETVFARSDNGLTYPTHSSQIKPGMVLGSFDSDIHQVSNLQAGDADLVTLHIYSPPLLVMGTYSLTSDRVEEFVDPILEFASGAGI